MEDRRLHLSLEIEPHSDPIRGRLHGRHGDPREFEGWMELAAELEAAIEGGEDGELQPGAWSR